MVRYDDLVMSHVPTNAVRVCQAGVGTLDNAKRRLQALSFAAVNRDHAELLDRNGKLVRGGFSERPQA